VSVNKSGGWVTFGNKNLFPQEIINANSKSPVNASIIESTVTYICGKGIRESTKNKEGYTGVPNTAESWDEVLEKIAKDYKTFGGFYWQVVINKGGTTVSLFHQDYSTVRIGLIDEKGHPLTFKISNDWTKTGGRYKPVELEAWPGMDTAKKGVAYLYHYWDYAPGLMFYSVPGYYPAIEYVKADGTLGVFYNNSIDNGFTPSVIIYMSSNPSDEKKAECQKAVEGAFAGARGASRAIIVWGENGDVRSKIEPFNASKNADIYDNVEGIVFQKIISAHRLSSPTLAGVSGSGNLSGNAAEIIDAYVLYNYTVIEKLRNKILDHLNKFTKINKTAPLAVEELDVLPKIRETEKADEEKETTTESTPPEKEAPAALTRKTGKLKRLLSYLHKYIRRESKPGGGYRYIYDEPEEGVKKKIPDTTEKSKTARERTKYLGEMKPLLKKKVKKEADGKTINIGFRNNGNRHIYSDTFGRAKELNKKDLKNLDKALSKSTFVKSAPLSKNRKDGISRFYYFRDASKKLYYNVAEKGERMDNGKRIKKYYLYSVTGNIK
jgi:hypothetical protein